MLYLSLRFFHLFFMATWIGALLFVVGDVRRSLAEPSAHLPLLRDRMRRANRVSAGSGWITVLTGVALIFVLGGFGSVPVPIHIGLLAGLLMIGVGIGVIGRTTAQIDAGIEAGRDPQSLIPLTKRLGMGIGIFHSLWLLTLVLMVFRTRLF